MNSARQRGGGQKVGEHKENVNGDGNRIVVIGVTSYFYQEMKRCEKEESVSAYLDVQAYLTWIQNIISPGEN